MCPAMGRGRGALEIESRVLDRGRIGAHGGEERIGVRPLLLVFVLRRVVALGERFVPPGVRDSRRGLRAVPTQRRRRLIERRAIRTRIDLEENLPRLDLGALVERQRVRTPPTCGRTATVWLGSTVPLAAIA